MKIFKWGVLIALSCSGWLLARADEEPSKDDLLAGHSAHGEAFNEGPRQKAYLMEGMPRISFPISSKNLDAQKFFNQGVGQLHGFWYFEAERSFRQVAALDTNCAMAYWGMAMANVNNEKRAKEFIRKAIDLKAKADRREGLWIDALAKFYKEKENKKEEKGGSSSSSSSSSSSTQRHREYVRSLENLLEEFPDDLEAKAFLVFKIWENDGKGLKISSHKAVDALASEVLAANPMHPVHHGRIHFWNNEKDQRALNSAARCGQSSPGIAHMWHMPGHTYSQLHRYADAAWQQEASARVDHAHMIRDRVLPDQIHNYAHNNEWLIRNLSYLGRAREAVDLAKNMIELPRHPKFNTLTKFISETNTAETSYAYDKRNSSASYGRSRLLEVLVRYELWDDLISLSETMYLEPTDIPEEQAKRLKALGLAFFGKGDVKAGKQQIAELEKLLKNQKATRQSVADEAEAKAREEKQADDKVAKAMADALQAQSGRMKNAETAIKELKLYQALAEEDKEAARKQLDDVKDLPKERLALIHLKLGDKEKAEKLAREAAEGATNQVQRLASYIDVLAQCGKTNETEKNFQRLRSIAGQADLDVPVIKRLRPIAEALHLPGDWRSPFMMAADTGERPKLNELGPFRWHPVPAPDWSLFDANGKKISLKDYRGKPVVAIFYLGFGCVHCLEQLNAFVPVVKDYAKAGISLVAISIDSPEGLKKTFKKGDAPFPLLSDEAMGVFKAYRAFDDFENIPLHGTFLIDGEGLVRWQDINYEPFKETKFLLEEAQRLLNMQARQFASKAKKKAGLVFKGK